MSAQGSNPYGRLHALLDLARVRHLTSNVARLGSAACLFTTLTGLNVGGTFAGSMDPENDLFVADKRGAFRAWAAEHSLTAEIVREVEEAGDLFEEGVNDVATCERRYHYMRGWLAQQAGAFELKRASQDSAKPAPAPPTRLVHVYDFKVVTLVALSDSGLDALAEVFENAARLKLRAIPDGPGMVEDAEAYGLEEWFDGEEG